MAESETTARIGSTQELSSRSPDRTTLIAFGLFILLAGGAPIAVRFTYEDLAPYWSATLRFSMAAIIFWLLMLYKGVPLPRRRSLLGAVIFGALSVGAAFLFFYYGLTRTAASLASTLGATVPLLTLFFAAAHKLEKMRRRGLIGGLLALAGIVVKLFPPCHPYATNAVAMTTGALMLAAASLIKGEPWVLPSSTTVWLASIYLIVASVGLFLLYLFILGRWTATGTSYAFVLNPLVTVVLATFLTDEIISLMFLAGAAVVLLGVYIGALLPGKEPAEPAKEDIQARPAAPTCV